jgi:hypothetical protein
MIAVEFSVYAVAAQRVRELKHALTVLRRIVAVADEYFSHNQYVFSGLKIGN